MSLWQLGEYSGYSGTTLDVGRITCAFCEEEGNWALEHHAEKKKPNGTKKLNFDTLKCGNCGGYALVFWSAGDSLHSSKVIPINKSFDRFPEHWGSDIGRYWIQAKRNLEQENWDATAIMAGSAMQLALRSKNAEGDTIYSEIQNLADKGILPPVMVEWANEVRWLRNPAVHPSPGQDETRPEDAQDVLQFLDFLLQYLFDLPHRIENYRARKKDR